MATFALPYSLITYDTERNPIIQSKYVALSITIIYILFTKVIGPSIMRNRKPMQLHLLMLLYNSFLVICNVYLSIQITLIAIETWPYRCDMKSSPIYTNPKEFDKISFLAFGVKFLELFDTVIFILRKNFHQVSFLHVFHHSAVFTMGWIALKFRLIGYYVIFIGSINFAVHVVLYLYYALSALGPSVRKYLWWKKYLTRLQIIQFFAIMLYMAHSAVTGCDKFDFFDKICFVFVLLIAALFLNFYYKTYNTKKKSS